jgi:hypothetical protein
LLGLLDFCIAFLTEKATRVFVHYQNILYVLTLVEFSKTSLHMWQKKVVLREFSLFGIGLWRGGVSEKP